MDLLGVVVGVVPLFRNFVDNSSQVTYQNLVDSTCSTLVVVPGFACHGVVEKIKRSQGKLAYPNHPNSFLVAGGAFQ